MQQKLPDVMTHTWKYLGHASENPMGVEAFGLFAGLGFVLSFGYWCTDFLVVQRAMAAENMSDARRTPLLAAFPKMIMPFIVIVPGIAALALSKSSQRRGFRNPILPRIARPANTCSGKRTLSSRSRNTMAEAKPATRIAASIAATTM